MTLKNLKIGTKLRLGFGVVVTLSVAVGLAGVFGLNKVYEKSTSLFMIKDIQKNFTEARLYLRSFSTLKDSSYYDLCMESITHVRSLMDTLQPRVQIKENLALFNNLTDGVKEYGEGMITYEQLVKAQLLEIRQLNALNKEILEELKSQNIPLSNPLYYYFTAANSNVGYMQIQSRDEYHEAARENIQAAIAEASRIKKGNLTTYLNDYAAVTGQLIENTKQYKGLDAKLVEAGKKALGNADKMSEITSLYINDIKKSTVFFLLLFTLIVILLSLTITYFIARYFTTMLGRGVKLAESYAAGEMTIVVPEEDLAVKDEMGDLARAMVAMGTKIKEVVATISEKSIIVSSASHHISSTTEQLSEGANEQASAVEEVSSSMEQMAANIQQNTENASQAEKITVLSAQMIRDVAAATRNSLESVRKITGKIGIINDIAFQTNILALNAAVEAARAGDQGKGFAVVASEVRKLAEHSKTAATEIVELTRSSLKATEEAETLMVKLLPEVEKSASLVKEIATASTEQNMGSDQINNAIQQLNTVTQQNASSSEQLASNAQELSREAEHLNKITAYFKVEDHIPGKIQSSVLPKIKTNPVPSKPKVVNNPTTQKGEKVRPKDPDKGIHLDLYTNADDNQYEKF